ncbi:hypothetical protein J3R83DRAFT_5342 [Lanmaoa asiatica]|nr:hypothetical protein J3R83DRAFT_5342 [Lanmaoa asiatica]
MPSSIIKAMEGPFTGTLATMMLYGVICMQTFHYAKNYATSDRAPHKLVGESITPLIQVCAKSLIRVNGSR